MGFLLWLTLLGSLIGGFVAGDKRVQHSAEHACAKQVGEPCSCGYIVTAPGRGHYVCFAKAAATDWRALQHEADEAYDRWLASEPK